jgi:DNA-binding transcriptional LysR family regulator
VPASLDIDLLRSWLAVADSGTLSRAAQRVHRTQSALSLQMQRLEGGGGPAPLLRTGRGVRLTAAGERLREHAQRLLALHDQALADLAEDPLSGVLRFGCPDDYAVRFLPPLLRGFAHRHPRVLVEVVCAPTPQLRQALARRELDLALVSVAEPATARACCAPSRWCGWARRAARPCGPTRCRWPCPAPRPGPPGGAGRAGRAGRRHRLAYASSSLAGLLAVVRSGQAISVLTQTAVPEDLLVLGDGAGLPPLPTLGIVLAHDRPRPSPVAQAFEALVQELLPGA